MVLFADYFVGTLLHQLVNDSYLDIPQQCCQLSGFSTKSGGLDMCFGGKILVLVAS